MRHISVVLAAVLSASAHGFGAAQPAQEVQQLFAQLQDAKTSDDAAARLKMLAESNADSRQYLATQLPALIAREASGARSIWVINPVLLNSIRLAGDLTIAEAVPVLVQSLDTVKPAGPTTLAETDRLDNDPVGKALAKIGEPAIGLVRNILENNNNNQSMRLRAVLVLYNMNSSAADQVLARQLQSETDPRVKLVIESRLKAHQKTGNH